MNCFVLLSFSFSLSLLFSLSLSLSPFSISLYLSFSLPLSLAEEYESVTGTEAEEIAFSVKGTLPHGESHLTGPFGTVAAPVIVKSVFDHRVVGCMGGNGDKVRGVDGEWW